MLQKRLRYLASLCLWHVVQCLAAEVLRCLDGSGFTQSHDHDRDDANARHPADDEHLAYAGNISKSSADSVPDRVDDVGKPLFLSRGVAGQGCVGLVDGFASGWR